MDSNEFLSKSQRARSSSSPLLSSISNESRRDILTTLRAQPEAFQKTETPLQETKTTFREWLRAQGKTKATIKETVNYAKSCLFILTIFVYDMLGNKAFCSSISSIKKSKMINSITSKDQSIALKEGILMIG